MARMLYPAPKAVNFDDFRADTKSPKALYGLPSDVKFCRTCAISNQRPSSSVEFKNQRKTEKKTIAFGDDEICDACKVKNLKSAIDWAAREQELKELCDKHRRDDGRYDCLVPGSGGKDSFMQAHLLKYKYGMNPLTCTWAPHIYTDWGWKNHQAWINAGFDNILFTPNGRVHRLMTRLAVENLFHPFQPFILGQKNLAPKIASHYDIQLIFYGENEAEYGNARADMNSATRSWEYFANNDETNVFLGGATLEELRQLGLRKADWEPYLPVDPNLIERKGLEVHYLGYYEKWHPQAAYYYSIEHGDFQSSPERTCGTYSTYNSIDDRVDDFHYHTTWIKFGIGRATYDASQEIRSGDLMREEGIALIKKYDGEFPKRWADQIYKYLSIPEGEFPIASKEFEVPIMDQSYYQLLCDSFRSPHLWIHDQQTGWRLRHSISEEDDAETSSKAAQWSGNQ